MLSASAIVVVYSAGYVITARAARLGEPSLIQGTTLSPKPGRLRDGTYLGEGRSQFGSVFVTVMVEGGRIANVWINAVTTTFPSQTIDGLRNQVVSRQSTNVDIVTGATGSSNAFVEAIQAALRQAQP